MRRGRLRACAWCGEPTRKEDLEVSLASEGAEIVVRWHLDDPACGDADPLCGQLADALGLEDGAEGDTKAAAAYLAILRRARAKGADHLRAVIDVVRDLPGRRTYRGPGETWGAVTLQPIRPVPVGGVRRRGRGRR